ncbi:MAG TPA: hypothetical protein VK761_03185 [Solirubrobacteraceae bacterium]|jgi:hypothetical protein|nr:hypothetical protein [Solirubrobacteraceae bacterium]
MSASPASESSPESVTRQLALELDRFGWQELQHESTRLGVSEEELVRFALLYYLADLDSGRIARRHPAAAELEPEQAWPSGHDPVDPS